MSQYQWSLLLELIDDCIDFVSVWNVNKRNINILCFGDSLTKGFANGGSEYYPYSDTLSKLMCRFVNENNEYSKYGITYSIHVSNVGVNGECISTTMHDRLFNILNQSDITFDAIIINGGSNDIYFGYSANKIWNNGGILKEKDVEAVDFMESTSSIQQIYEMTREYKQNPDVLIVAITILPFKSATESMIQNMSTVNQRIRRYCKESQHQNHFILCDVATQFPSFDVAPKYWDSDGCHLTENGYALFGQIAFKSMRDWLRRIITV